MPQVVDSQKQICEKYGANYLPLDPNLKLGVSENFLAGKIPLNGLRHSPEDACGWYLWAGEELSDDPDFFKPMHVKHLIELQSPIVRYLGLPAGWRFLVAENYEDVWFDAKL